MTWRGVVDPGGVGFHSPLADQGKQSHRTQLIDLNSDRPAVPRPGRRVVAAVVGVPLPDASKMPATIPPPARRGIRNPAATETTGPRTRRSPGPSSTRIVLRRQSRCSHAATEPVAGN
jgi:hypothetical protein